MKKIYLLIAIVVLGITFGCEMNANKLSISVVSKEDSYSFKATYLKHKTEKVVVYLEENFKHESFFSNAEGIKDEYVTLSDSARFHLTSKPGFIKIDFNKRNNSATSYQKMVKLCMGIKEILK